MAESVAAALRGRVHRAADPSGPSIRSRRRIVDGAFPKTGQVACGGWRSRCHHAALRGHDVPRWRKSAGQHRHAPVVGWSSTTVSYIFAKTVRRRIGPDML